jgi:hypothetical protein
MNTDLFISRASEDKDEVARPLAEELTRRGFRVWYDEYSLDWATAFARRSMKVLPIAAMAWRS